MSGRTRATVAFITVTILLFLFDAMLIAVTALGCSGVTHPGDSWAGIAFLWMAAIPLTVMYAYRYPSTY
ncbi:hypothetical protein [uncultured Bifidobacterium sp.]|uniref:hypothetical protein n=1 Tax=uncultured Bifidobacterium sp. TaxID=165187 RepID=UPI0025856D1A|nr:hypothetical protein [uncultured Bifidobacterium sp.]